MELIVRTSDRGAFKRCRLSWDWGSKIRQDYIQVGPLAAPLDFGTAIHYALEVYYNPDTWDSLSVDPSLVQDLSMAAFRRIQKEQLTAYLKSMGDESLRDDLRAEYKERNELGEGMLLNYFKYAATHDADWLPIATEVEFEVPIEGLEGTPIEGAVYQGRIDLVIQSRATGRYWIVDHKTAARLDSTAHLDLDPQCGSYAWAIQQQLGVRVDGVIYNELYKGVPGYPNVLKNGNLSKSKSQDTTYENFVEALNKMYGGIPEEYVPVLDHYKHAPQEYIRRTQIHRTPAELRSIGRDITEEAQDMLDANVRIYPNPTKFNCQYCAFRQPCLMRQDGSDVEMILKERYIKRSLLKAEANG